MNPIKQVYLIAATPEEVWQALTEPALIEEWSGADAQFLLEEDADYSLWDGDIRGRVLEFVPAQRLVQTWEPENWARRDSFVTFTLTPTVDGTRVELVHENVEDWDYDGTNDGWDTFYLGALKRMLEARSPKPAQATKTAKRAVPEKKQAKPHPTKQVRARKSGPKKKTIKKSAKRKG